MIIRAIPVIAAVIPSALPITTIIVIIDNNHWNGLQIFNRWGFNLNRFSPFLPVKKRIYLANSAICVARKSKQGCDPQTYQKNKFFEIFHDNERDK